MLTSFIVVLMKLFKKQEELKMLVRLYAAEIILGNITIDDVPKRLKDKVIAYLEEMGVTD